MAIIRIGLCGAGGTGKGTLVREFGKKHPEVKCIYSCVEHVGKILDPDSGNYKDMQAWLKPSFQQTILAAQAETERTFAQNNLSYISERSLVDFLPYMERVLKSIAIYGRPDKDERKAYFERIKMYVGDNPYTHLFFLPQDDFTPVKDESVAWKERDPLDRIRTDDSIRTALQEIGEKFGIPVTVLRGSVEERLDEMEKQIFPNKDKKDK